VNGEICIGEVYFFILFCIQEQEFSLVLISLYLRPCPTLLKVLVNTLWSCKYQGDSGLIFIDVKSIRLVVAMIPHVPLVDGQQAGKCFFLVEKPGFDVAVMAGMEEGISEEGTGTVNRNNVASTIV
jgi:hypothetical protein